jgi:DNA modification methylase
MGKRKPRPANGHANGHANGTATVPAPALRLEWRSPAELTENPRNWRTHPEAQSQALSDVLADVGWAGACLFNETTGRLIDGHARRKVALDRGESAVPVLVGAWSEAQEATILATLDPLGAMATADAGRLDALLRDVATDSAPLAAMLRELAAAHAAGPGLPAPGAGGDEFDPTPDAGPTRCQPGDLWLIGGTHRLLCGDSTDAAAVARLMDGERAGLCFTSPPYAQQRDYGAKITDWNGLMRGVFGNLPMADDGQVLVNLGLIHRDGEWVPYWDGWIEWMRSQGWRRFGWYVWDKLAGMPGDWGGRMAPAHEFVWHFNRQPVDPIKAFECKDAGRVVAGRTRGANGELRIHTSTKRGDAVQSHKIGDSVVRCGTTKGQESEHPATMPLAMPDHFVRSWPGDVYDPFLGSGTTLVAAHRLGRRCFGAEISAAYCDVILRRAAAENLTAERLE